MNRKQLTLLIVLGVVLGGLGYWVYNKREAGYERGTATSEEGTKLLKGLPANAIRDVTQLTIKQGTNEVNLAVQGERWTVKERGGYPANFNNISDTVRKFWDLKVARAVEVGPSRLPSLKLTKTDGTLVDLKDAQGKSIAAITLGMQTSKEAREDSQFGGGSFPNGRYVMRGDDVKTVALVSDPLSVEAKPEDWLNKDWFKVERIKSVSVVTTNATNNWKLTRETDGAEWKLADAKAGEAADGSKTSGLNWLLSSPSFNDVMVDPKPETTGLDKPTVATIETLDGFSYTLKIGQPSGGEENANHALQVSITANLPKERTPGKDEKPEDKDKLDKEFAAKQKPLEEKLKNEKAFEKWTYVVPKFTLETLLKDRKDFLAEKKEEPKKDDAKPGEAPKPADQGK
jgi:hypothetical protein